MKKVMKEPKGKMDKEARKEEKLERKEQTSPVKKKKY